MRTHTSALQLYHAQVGSFRKVPGAARQQWRAIPEAALRDLQAMAADPAARRTSTPYVKKKGGRVPQGASPRYVKRAGPTKAALLPGSGQAAKLRDAATLRSRSVRSALEYSVGFDSGKVGNYAVPRGVWAELSKRGNARLRAYQDVFLRTQRAAFAAA